MATISCTFLLYLISVAYLLVCVCSLENQTNISLGSKLTTTKNPKWVSPNGDFAFGFRNITPRSYVVGVWLDNISPKTVVWTVNGDHPLKEGSTLELNATGLRLFDSLNNFIWAAGVPENPNLSGAALLDNGNFMLLIASFEPAWQSFDTPTDTLLPGQKLQSQSSLRSKASDANYSSGRFELLLQGDGDLVLYPADRPIKGTAYWGTKTWKTFSNPSTLNFDESGVLHLNAGNKAVWNATPNGGPGRFLRRVTLDSDGILRQYVWNRNGSTSWSVVWQEPNDSCLVKGQCGLNGICQVTLEGSPNCTCPPGFGFIDENDPFKGCHQQARQSCSSESNNTMSELSHTDWSTGDERISYGLLSTGDKEECKKACLQDCMCIVAIYDGQGSCWKKQTPLINGRRDLNITYTALVKVSHDPLIHGSGSPQGIGHGKGSGSPQGIVHGKGRGVLIIGISLLSCSSFLRAASLLINWRCRCGLKAKVTQLQHKFGEGSLACTYKEVYAATGGFRQEVGKGGFGKVYKGTLPDGKAIAVKKLEKLEGPGQGEKEFRTEMNVISTCHHRNLVKLYGFCDEKSHRLLIYEYMSNGSLDGIIFVSNGFLDWNLRVQIGLGIARGILYLHEECASQIIHCDIKPSNILLDDGFNPKISDFGLAKLMRAEQSRTLTAARGTDGYIAPEWRQRNAPITVKVDVYSFGVMLLEIVCCRKHMKFDAAENEIILSGWVYDCFKQGRLATLVDRQQMEGDAVDLRQLERMVMVGLWCIQTDPFLRPSIKTVVHMLEGTVEISVPPAPGNFY